MKKFGKFLFSTLSLAAAAGGLYCLYKNHVNKNADEDFDDFDDSMDDFDEESTVNTDPENREYVSITITTEDSKADADSAESETAEENAASEETAASEEAAEGAAETAAE